jgi:hypothetical protein
LILIDSQDETSKLGAAGPPVKSTKGGLVRKTFEENDRQSSQEMTDAVFKVFSERSKSLKASKDRKESKKVSKSETFCNFSARDVQPDISEEKVRSRERRKEEKGERRKEEKGERRKEEKGESPKVEKEKRKSRRRKDEKETNGQTHAGHEKETGNSCINYSFEK